jgi:ABC-type antimicrobial peptide transport system permease subunit
VALTNATQDFIIKNGVIVLGQNPVTDSVDQNGALQVYGGAAIAQNLIVGTTGTFGNALFVTTTATIGQDLSVGSSATIAQGINSGWACHI